MSKPLKNFVATLEKGPSLETGGAPSQDYQKGEDPQREEEKELQGGKGLLQEIGIGEKKRGDQVLKALCPLAKIKTETKNMSDQIDDHNLFPLQG